MNRPILFGTPMVKALLSGNKRMTRRVMQPQPVTSAEGIHRWKNLGWVDGVKMWDDHRAPYRRGDVLWVRETWQEMPYGYVYRADYNQDKEEEPEGWDPDDRWRPSVHMPKEAARLFLKVTGVRMERLQDITEADVEAEGTDLKAWYDYDERQHQGVEVELPVAYETMRDYFGHTIWDSTLKNREAYEKYCWNANPWVWVIMFERCEKPEGFCAL